MTLALYRFLVLALLVAILALLALHVRADGALTGQLQLLQTRVEQVEAAGSQQAEAVAALEGAVERLQASAVEQDGRLRVLRRDADRIAEHDQALQALQARVDRAGQQAEAVGALQDQVAGVRRDAQALQERLGGQAEATRALQGRTDELAATVGDLAKTVQEINDRVGRPGLPGLSLPGITIPIRP
jgi:chromosome segregation ATPase